MKDVPAGQPPLPPAFPIYAYDTIAALDVSLWNPDLAIVIPPQHHDSSSDEGDDEDYK
jgi:hypothetical protein